MRAPGSCGRREPLCGPKCLGRALKRGEKVREKVFFFGCKVFFWGGVIFFWGGVLLFYGFLMFVWFFLWFGPGFEGLL